MFLMNNSNSKYLKEKKIIRSVALVPENTEDIWHAYNLISEGDFVSCSTIR